MNDQHIKHLLALALAIKAGAPFKTLLPCSVRLYQDLFLKDWCSPLLSDIPCLQDQEAGKNRLQDCPLATSFRDLQKTLHAPENRPLSVQERSELLTLVGKILS